MKLNNESPFPGGNGTTPEVLSLYLPYKCILHAPTDLGYWPCLLQAVNAFTGKAEYQPVFEGGHLGASFQCYCTSILPMLRPFEMLDKEMPDGTVPASEIAKLAQGRFSNGGGVWGEPQVMADRIRIEYKMPRSKSAIMIMAEDWSVAQMMSDGHGDWVCSQAAIVDYLRRHHFAVPAGGQILAQDVDFIRKP